MGQVRTWVLYELRGATRAECFFILYWGHETLSFPGKSVCLFVCANVCVPRMLPLLTQQLLLLTPSILKGPTRRLPPHTSDWPPPPLIDPCQRSLRLPELPQMQLRVRRRLPWLLLLLLLSTPSVLLSRRLSGRWPGSAVRAQLGVEPEWRLYCCTVMPLSSVAAVSQGDWASSVCGMVQSLPSSLAVLRLLLSFCLTRSLLPTSSFARQISSFVWKVTKQPPANYAALAAAPSSSPSSSSSSCFCATWTSSPHPLLSFYILVLRPFLSFLHTSSITVWNINFYPVTFIINQFGPSGKKRVL